MTVVEYGDFECPYCGEAEPVIRELLADYGDVHYVWRHLPLTDVHPHAQLAAEGAEAAARQGRFWEMHDLLLDHQGALTARDLRGYAAELGLDVGQVRDDLRRHAGASKIASDVDSADLSGVSGHADVLHQRPAPPRRLRHRQRWRPRSARPGPGPAMRQGARATRPDAWAACGR